ncbi:carbohydrate ABC transporter permease [Paenibacillus sp. MBLB4367]|uniref:carbohydrate ABC transporter permease n=1 Tax=Paenibacillus sp. MBLB4367 TaxID=3384767 RepID=UPI003907F460
MKGRKAIRSESIRNYERMGDLHEKRVALLSTILALAFATAGCGSGGPPALIEAAKIDGAGEIKTFCRIVLPLSLPILATIGLFEAILYWNDWFNGLTYVTDPKLFSIQNILNRLIQDIQFLNSNSSLSSSGTASKMAELPSTSVRMAIAVGGVLPILIVYPFFQKYFVKGVTIGAVK